MKRAVVLPALIVLIFGMSGPDPVAQESDSLPVLNLPGRLQTLLANSQCALVQRKVVGTLLGPSGTEARFSAIRASDPRDTDRTAGGLEVLLRAGKREATVYLDEDGLEAFENRLIERLREMKQYSERADVDARQDGGIRAAFAINHVDESAHPGSRRAIVLLAGWYVSRGEFGVAMDCAPGGTYYFPGKHLSEVAGIIDRGRIWLSRHGRGQSSRDVRPPQ